jgi:hypothetical protein
MQTLIYTILISVEYGSKKFGCKLENVRKLMIARMNNIYKVEKAKEKSQKSKRLKSFV